MRAYGLARIGRDVVVRQTQSGKSVANVSLAFNYGYGENKGVQWVEASLWGAQAERAAPYLTKGTFILANLEDAHLQQYQKADGTPAAKMVARMSSFDFASAPTEKEPPKQEPKPVANKQTGGDFDDMDDDIPF